MNKPFNFWGLMIITVAITVSVAGCSKGTAGGADSPKTNATTESTTAARLNDPNVNSVEKDEIRKHMDASQKETNGAAPGAPK